MNNKQYDVDFQSSIRNQTMSNKSGYMVEKELKEMTKKSKISLVKLVWSSVFLIVILIFNSVLLVSYF